jgi:hypothetical protein
MEDSHRDAVALVRLMASDVAQIKALAAAMCATTRDPRARSQLDETEVLDPHFPALSRPGSKKAMRLAMLELRHAILVVMLRKLKEQISDIAEILADIQRRQQSMGVPPVAASSLNWQ